MKQILIIYICIPILIGKFLNFLRQNFSLFRLEKEKADAYSDVDRSRDKYEKLQVIHTNN